MDPFLYVQVRPIYENGAVFRHTFLAYARPGARRDAAMSLGPILRTETRALPADQRERVRVAEYGWSLPASTAQLAEVKVYQVVARNYATVA